MTVLRTALAACALTLVVLILWALASASFGASFSAIAADPWGVVTLVDLYLGFLVAAVFIATFENRGAALILIVLLLVLGNVVAALWLAWRAPTIVQRLNLRREA